MLSDTLLHQLQQSFALTPTDEQAEAFRTFAAFMLSREDRAAMILRGSAGTGKTSVAAAIVRTMDRLKQKTVLLAPTGRAAKVFSQKAGHPAFTIHRRIYRQKSIDGGFTLAPNLASDTLYLVDEASMIANYGAVSEGLFGTGRLLDDLVSFVYSGTRCRLMLIGDKAQLPPVGEDDSPALSSEFMAGYALDIHEADLNTVLRQSQQSGILYNATVIRELITRDEATQLPRIRFHGFADIVLLPGGELIDTLSASYSEVGVDETMVITRSNKRANIYNQGIRNTVLDLSDLLSSGDIIMIVKNNYYWMEQEFKAMAAELKTPNSPLPIPQMPSFLANGDRAIVRRVRHTRELYGFTFADLLLQFPDYDDYELTATVLTDSLTTEAPSLTQEQSNRLFNAVLEDYADERTKPERMKRLKQDPYFNAIQIKYAYAVTCHKAQGGQWAHVYVDQGYMTDDMLTPDYIHWLYTAFTRATERLYLVNWPANQTCSED